jgi:hypothetical protein
VLPTLKPSAAHYFNIDANLPTGVGAAEVVKDEGVASKAAPPLALMRRSEGRKAQAARPLLAAGDGNPRTS